MGQCKYSFTHNLGANLIWVISACSWFYILVCLALKMLIKAVTFSWLSNLIVKIFYFCQQSIIAEHYPNYSLRNRSGNFRDGVHVKWAVKSFSELHRTLIWFYFWGKRSVSWWHLDEDLYSLNEETQMVKYEIYICEIAFFPLLCSV